MNIAKGTAIDHGNMLKAAVIPSSPRELLLFTSEEAIKAAHIGDSINRITLLVRTDLVIKCFRTGSQRQMRNGIKEKNRRSHFISHFRQDSGLHHVSEFAAAVRPP